MYWNIHSRFQVYSHRGITRAYETLNVFHHTQRFNHYESSVAEHRIWSNQSFIDTKLGTFTQVYFSTFHLKQATQPVFSLLGFRLQFFLSHSHKKENIFPILWRCSCFRIFSVVRNDLDSLREHFGQMESKFRIFLSRLNTLN